MLEIVTFTLGPAMTNAYLVADSETKEAAVIDPAWDGHAILTEAIRRGWRIAHLWYTHAHFDHIGGAAAIADALNPLPLVALHPADHVLWRSEGGAPCGHECRPRRTPPPASGVLGHRAETQNRLDGSTLSGSNRRAAMMAIGESHRMTLKFRKPE